MATKQEFLARIKRKTTTFKSQLDNGFECRIRRMTDREISEYELHFIDEQGEIIQEKLKEARRLLVQRCIVDEDDQLLFSAADLDDLAESDGAIIKEIHDFCREYCGLDKKKEPAKELGDTRKN